MEAAEEMFARLAEIGEVEEAGRYPGRYVGFGGEERAGLRGSSLSAGSRPLMLGLAMCRR